MINGSTINLAATSVLLWRDITKEGEMMGPSSFRVRDLIPGSSYTFRVREYVGVIFRRLYLFSIVAMFHDYWCTRKSWSSFIMIYNSNTIAHNHHTNNNQYFTQINQHRYACATSSGGRLSVQPRRSSLHTRARPPADQRRWKATLTSLTCAGTRATGRAWGSQTWTTRYR